MTIFLSRFNSSRSFLWWALTALFAAYPLFSLGTAIGHRFIPVFLLLISLGALIFRKGRWSSHLTLWAVAVVLLTLPHYLSYWVNGGDASSMERVSYGWLFLPIGALIVWVKPGIKLLFFGLIIGAGVTLGAQLMAGGSRPSLGFNPIPFAELAAGFFCLLSIGLLYVRNLWQTLAVLCGLVIWILVIVLSESRGALLAAVPGVVFIIVFCIKRFGNRLSLVAGVALFMVAMGVELVSGNLMSQRFIEAWGEVRLYADHPEKVSSVAVRLELYRGAVMIANRHPVGLGDVGARHQVIDWVREGQIYRYVRASMIMAHFHSDFFQQLALTGYLGGLCLLLFYSLLIRHFYRHRDQLPAQLGLIFISSFIISGLTDVPLHNRLTLLSLFTVLTYCLASLRDKPAQNSDSVKTGQVSG